MDELYDFVYNFILYFFVGFYHLHYITNTYTHIRHITIVHCYFDPLFPKLWMQTLNEKLFNFGIKSNWE